VNGRGARAGLLITVVSIALSGCSPPLRIKPNEKGVLIDVQTLGEYQTSISRLRLADDRTGKVLWELVAVSEAPQINKVQLSAGANPARIVGRPLDRKYRVVTPAGRDTFQLEAGAKYTIEVWGERSWLGPKRASFDLPARR